MRDIIPLILGIMIFLLGLYLMRMGLANLAGDRLKGVLLKFTKSTPRSFLTGIIATACLQSSTAIIVITINFVNANIITFFRSIGIILGANIGTTVTTQIVALHIERFSIPLIIIGVIISILPIGKSKYFGFTVNGLGMLFLGIQMMQITANYLKQNDWIKDVLSITESPVIVGILLGALVTALTHSSSATTAMAMSFYALGTIDLTLAISIVFGSNIGTCLTGIIASINTNSAAKKVAFANILLNIIGVVIFAPFTSLISKYAPYLSNDPGFQIAHIQTLFNLVSSIIILPIVRPFAALINYIYRDYNESS